MHLLTSMAMLAQSGPAAPLPRKHRTSYLMWVWESLGLIYGTVPLLLGILVFIAAVMIVRRNRRPEVIACGVFFALAPVLVGIFGTIDGMLHSFQFMGPDDPCEMTLVASARVARATFSTAFGMVCSLPAYCVLAGGYFLRAIQPRGNFREDLIAGQLPDHL